MSEENLLHALKALFQEHQVVFWYDEKGNLSEEFEALDLAGAEKLKVNNNEFQLKHRIQNETELKFLLYFPNGEPEYKKNWLLDIQLAQKVFNSDRESIILQDLGLAYHFKGLVREHIEFFDSKERQQKLKDLLSSDERDKSIRYKMLAVCFNLNVLNLQTILQAYASAFNDGNHRIEKALDRYQLSEFLWKEVKAKFEYKSEAPTIYDFLLEVFSKNSCLTQGEVEQNEGKVLLSLWKDSLSFRDAFRALSAKISKDLSISQELNELNFEAVLEEDLYQEIDQKVIADLVQSLTTDSLDVARLSKTIKQRENKFWFQDYKEIYQTLKFAGLLLDKIQKTKKGKYNSVEEGAHEYASTLFEADYYYRKFLFHHTLAEQNSILKPLYEKVEKAYSNNWLLETNDLWQQTIDDTAAWPLDSSHSQRGFFQHHVKPVLDRGQRLFVVISDALRYENGWELSNLLKSEQRYDAELDYLIASVPSYTQLGMASLLPGDQLSIQAKDSTVLVDGLSSSGVPGRSQVLEKNSGVRATAIAAEKFMNFSAATEGREFVKAYDLIYIYHNQIDKTGDDKTSEGKLPQAVEAELGFLKSLLKQIANVNGSNILITSDHGYIYQNEALADSDFSDAQVKGEIWKENRRFVLGKILSGNMAVKHFNGKDLGLDSETEVLLPKSINRLRIKGAGSRFVHGGASLQEIVLPLVQVTKKRKDTNRLVDVELIKSTDKITTNILAVTFIQKDLVDDKVLPRQIRASIKAKDGTTLSDVFSFNFNIEEGAERERSVQHRFQLSAAASGKYKNQRVNLVLEEPVANSNKWKAYAEHSYSLNISFTNDFDDF